MLKYTITVCLCASALLFGCQASAHGGSKTMGQLAITLTSDVTEVALHESLPITVVFRNVGDDAVSVYKLMFKEADAGALRVVRPDGSSVTLDRPEYTGVSVFYSKRPERLLEVGEEFSTSFEVSCDWPDAEQHSIFDSEGIYELVVEYDDQGVQARSNALRVNVVAPSRDETAALEVVTSMKLPGALYEADVIGRDKGALVSLRELSDFNKSRIYANYARASLAAWSLELAESGVGLNDAERAAELEIASKYLDAIPREGLTIQDRVNELRLLLSELQANLENKSD